MASGRQVPRVNVPELIRDDVPATGERCGLASADAVRLLAEHGRNELRADPGPTILSRIGHQLHDPMILLLCGAFALVVAVGDRADAAIIAAVVVLNTAIGVVQDVRAQHAIDALSRMAAPRGAGLARWPAASSSRRPSSSRGTWSGSRPETSYPPTCRCSRPRLSRSTRPR